MLSVDSAMRVTPDRQYVTTTEQIILMALIAAGRDASTKKIKEVMRVRLGRAAPINSASVILKRMHLQGLVEQRPIIGAVGSQKLAKSHNITRRGMDALKNALALVEQARADIDLNNVFVIEEDDADA